MKVRPSVKPICDNCKVVKRRGVVMVICKTLSISNDKVNLRRIINGKNCWCWYTKR